MSFFASVYDPYERYYMDNTTAETMQAEPGKKKPEPKPPEPVIEEPKIVTPFEAFNKHHKINTVLRVGRKELEAAQSAFLTHGKVGNPNYGDYLIHEYGFLTLVQWMGLEYQKLFMTDRERDQYHSLSTTLYERWKTHLKGFNASPAEGKLRNALFNKQVAF